MIIIHPLGWSYYLKLSLDGLDDLSLLVVVLLISSKESNKKLSVTNLLSCLLYPWSPSPLQYGSKQWKLGCVD